MLRVITTKGNGGCCILRIVGNTFPISGSTPSCGRTSAGDCIREAGPTTWTIVLEKIPVPTFDIKATDMIIPKLQQAVYQQLHRQTEDHLLFARFLYNTKKRACPQ